MSNIKHLPFAMALAATLSSMSAMATPPDQFPNGQSYYGQAVDVSASERTVTLSPGAKLNVKYGETLQFVSAGKSFAWRFNGLDWRAVDLQRIAPTDFDAKNATVYVNKDPLQRW
jgi:hypothetical protein